MYKLNENDFEYRFGDSGPKYLMRGPRASFGVVVLKKGEDFSNHCHNVMEENFFILEGEIEFTVKSPEKTETAVCGKGDYIHIEPGEQHYLRNIHDGDSKAIFCLAPFMDKDKTDC
jgi:quercetin dioxygenase-like cupin family protein